MAKPSYEDIRQKRMEENKKRLEDLNLPRLAQSLNRTLSLKPSPMKKAGSKPHNSETQLVAVRRSARVASNPAPVYAEVKMERIGMSRSCSAYGIPRGNSRYPAGLLYVSEEARARATEKAEQLVEKLGTSYPTLVRPLLPSHVSSCFWLVSGFVVTELSRMTVLLVERVSRYNNNYALTMTFVRDHPIGSFTSNSDSDCNWNLEWQGLPMRFCRDNMPRKDELVTLVDEEGDEYPTMWLQRKTGLSGGWRGFSLAHGLVDGDAVVFQVIKHGVLKVYIIRAHDLDDDDET
ncbi:B3 domain-containing protein [Drosera capensis]